MFKDDKITPMCNDHFGAGSTVIATPVTYLVVRLTDTSVALIDSADFKVMGYPVNVKDPNYLTESEARTLVDQVGNILNWTFTDFELCPKGHKCKKFGVNP